MRRGQRSRRSPSPPSSGRSHGSPPRAAFPYDPSVALPTRRPTDRATVITDTDAPEKSRGTEGWFVSLESPLLSRVVRLLSFGTGDPPSHWLDLSPGSLVTHAHSRSFSRKRWPGSTPALGGLLGENSSRDCTYFNGVSSDIL